ncbi:P37 [Xanthomonas phage phiL7]|uniref:p37 n=1 Tax=Xanthomonas phage phiL7 TaxID=538979 RepID=C4ML37_9CAUD|nr:P37 [Xanthomonas phage phiL7]ACE75777.1 P37 [Xanthomonas phage phiL7]
MRLRWYSSGTSPAAHHTTSLKVIARADPATVPKLNDGARLPSSLPNDSATRKEYPLAEVLFGQFPAACVAVAHHSYKGNQKHNPGKPLQDNRSLSNDDASCIMRHLMEGDYEGVAWRALRLLQKKLESEGAPVAPLATFK